VAGDEWNERRRGDLGGHGPARPVGDRGHEAAPPTRPVRPVGEPGGGGPARPVGEPGGGGAGRPVGEPGGRGPGRPVGGRERAAAPRRRPWALLTGYATLGLVSLVILGVSGYAWNQYRTLSTGIKTSDAIAGGPKSVNGDTNILVMGLDTRLDENGNPLPQNIYDALHAGNQADGGNNSNVLMLLHVPGNGSKATAISIPRDDYVSLPGCPDGQCKGKIKQAYGLAFDQESKQLANQNITDRTQREQAERDAGRKAEIATVEQFLGGVAVDHFVEVTLVAFFQIAQVVQPITVCVNEDTQDSYSGANFHKGQQQISASQALAFVRQRRDNVHPELNFTDLDRERRQQAFISSLAYQLKQGGTFTSPSKLTAILNVAKQNIAIDTGLDLLSFAQQASNLTGGNITFFTLPIDHFGQDSNGQDVNIVNVPLIQSTVHNLLYGASGASTPAAPTSSAPPTSSPATPAAVVDVVNASARSGYAARVEAALSSRGFTQGTASTQRTVTHTSVIEYGPGAATAASAASTLLGGMTVRSDSAISADTLRVVLGTDFTFPSSLGGGGSAGAPSTSAPPPASAVPATGGGVAGPPPSALSALSGGGIPCVK
jgi:LCP family protein required for cell wall assembly